uniref:DNA-directed RNA polymerase III subunit n=1 Tax=Romanomermis culicivorax TaxID=13658 RepID=A0A915JD33_ROMCU
MSRGGRGGKTSGLSILANALGLQRTDFSKPSNAIPAPTLFPSLDVKPLSLATTSDYEYMVESKQEFLRRMHESPYYIKPRNSKSEIQRYSDKFKKRRNATWSVNYNRLPRILWPKGMLNISSGEIPKFANKRARIEQDSKFKATLEASIISLCLFITSDRLSALEKKENTVKDADTLDDNVDKTAKKSNDEENVDKNEDEQELSDEDYQEEDNDYIQSYFDNGEDYADESDDNLDGEATY